VEGKGRKGEDPITPSPDHTKISHLSVAQDTFRGKASKHTECVQEPT
jgi:hypothetical protein